MKPLTRAELFIVALSFLAFLTIGLAWLARI